MEDKVVGFGGFVCNESTEAPNLLSSIKTQEATECVTVEEGFNLSSSRFPYKKIPFTKGIKLAASSIRKEWRFRIF